jgi:hypothetical protein
VSGPLLGRALLLAMWRENRRLRRGHTYEPPTFYETSQRWVAAGRPAMPETVGA